MSSDTPSSILHAAQRLFSQQGYTATAMHEIAAEAGIGKATIYHHFKSKEEILLSLVNGSIDQLHGSLRTIQNEEEPRRRLRVAAELSINFLFGSVELIQIARREVPGVREKMVDRFISFFAEYSAILEQTFQKGIDMGIFRAVDPHDTAAVFLTMIQGNFARFYLTRMRFETPEKAADEMLKVFFNGINAVPEVQDIGK
jgi:TetR/AcrR family transcriptional regulator, cholesterol catabolism regulator